MTGKQALSAQLLFYLFVFIVMLATLLLLPDNAGIDTIAIVGLALSAWGIIDAWALGAI